MRIIGASEARSRLAEVMDRVCDGREPAVLTRSGGREPMVILTLEDYEAMVEAVTSPGDTTG